MINYFVNLHIPQNDTTILECDEGVKRGVTYNFPPVKANFNYTMFWNILY